MDPLNEVETTADLTVEALTPAPAGPTQASTMPSASREGDRVPRVDIVAGSGVHLSDETRSLLQARLRAVALALSAAFGAFLLRNLWLGNHYLDPLLVACHTGVVAVFVGSVAALSVRRPIGLRRLRTLELFLFGMTVAFFLASHYRIAQLRLADGDRVMLMATVKNVVLFVFAMIVAYGMFIPNTWRRAAVVMGSMAVATILSPLALHLVRPGLARPLARLLTPEVASENILMLVVAAAVTTYATHVFNTLRIVAFQARQLNQYRLKGRLGAGGMGEVFLAEHQLLKRPCAIKLIAPGRADDPKALARFEREVRTTAKLSHPNTVEIYDYGRTDDGTFYYVMELLQGLNLADLVARHGPLPAGRVIFLLRQACGALAEAHAVGLVHRDLKPANVFAARRGHLHDFVKLLDFGLVLPPADPTTPELSRDRHVVGSPLYMAPEQATGTSRPDARTDLYGLGAVGYYLLTGRTPFAGPTATAVLVAVARDPVVPPTRLRPDLSPDLESVILRCLSKDPSDRYPDAEALDRDLGRCQAAPDWDFARAAAWWSSFHPLPQAPVGLQEARV
jgi:serine/threonine-protein kinase